MKSFSDGVFRVGCVGRASCIVVAGRGGAHPRYNGQYGHSRRCELHGYGVDLMHEDGIGVYCFDRDRRGCPRESRYCGSFVEREERKETDGRKCEN